MKAHHDKDYRALAVYPIQALEQTRVLVVRIDYKGDILLEAITGAHWGPGGHDLWALIWKGHMTLLRPPTASVASKLLDEIAPYTTPCLGFHYFWHQRHDQPLTSPGVLHCRLCKPAKKAGAFHTQGFVRKETCQPVLASFSAGAGVARKQVRQAVTPSSSTTGSGLVLQEFFAGHGVLSQGWINAGEVALEPIELYEKPHLKQGRRELHDLTKPSNQQRYLESVAKGESNVQWIACPCTTYCDWNLQNNGTRTFAEPHGITEQEQMGNTMSEFGATLFEISMLHNGFPIAESSGPSGRYPKQWNLPAWQRLLQRPDVDFIEIDMCAYGLGPPQAEEPNHFYKHRAFPHNPAFRAALLRLCPGLSATHQHTALKGARPGSTVSRCTEAGVYAADFVKVVVAALQQCVVGGGVSSPQSPGRLAGSSHDAEGEDDGSPSFCSSLEEEEVEEESPKRRTQRSGMECGVNQMRRSGQKKRYQPRELWEDRH